MCLTEFVARGRLSYAPSKEPQMANIDEELAVAREARAAIEKRPREFLAILRKALYLARQSILFSSALNHARNEAGKALSTLIVAVKARRETPERINRAKYAIDAWIEELEAARP